MRTTGTCHSIGPSDRRERPGRVPRREGRSGTAARCHGPAGRAVRVQPCRPPSIATGGSLARGPPWPRPAGRLGRVGHLTTTCRPTTTGRSTDGVVRPTRWSGRRQVGPALGRRPGWSRRRQARPAPGRRGSVVREKNRRTCPPSPPPTGPRRWSCAPRSTTATPSWSATPTVRRAGRCCWTGPPSRTSTSTTRSTWSSSTSGGSPTSRTWSRTRAGRRGRCTWAVGRGRSPATSPRPGRGPSSWSSSWTRRSSSSWRTACPGPGRTTG